MRATLGAAVGIGLCMLLATLVPSIAGQPVALLAPLGATAVLIFAVPNTPLAQPWSAIMGNIVSTLVVVAVLRFLPGPWSPALAVSGAIMAMLLARALHPPGGAVALLAALDPAPVLAAGFIYALMPVGLMTIALVAAGTAFNRLTGRVYPFRQPQGITGHDHRVGLSDVELATLLKRFNQTPNIGIADLGRIVAAAAQEAANHRFDGITCAEVMTPDLITVGPDTPLVRVGRLFRRHLIESVPVIDPSGRLLGVILQRDLIEALLSPRRGSDASKLATAASIMRSAEGAVADDLPVGQLLARLAAQGGKVVPVTHDGMLTGIITRSDIMKLLLDELEGRQTPVGRPDAANGEADADNRSAIPQEDMLEQCRHCGT
ncbi:MAG TPA: HPP family protein [Sphingobium sp.]|nr:HPP family protein [Sphingobium sp.]